MTNNPTLCPCGCGADGIKTTHICSESPCFAAVTNRGPSVGGIVCHYCDQHAPLGSTHLRTGGILVAKAGSPQAAALQALAGESEEKAKLRRWKEEWMRKYRKNSQQEKTP
jgi:hypothetical protein